MHALTIITVTAAAASKVEPPRSAGPALELSGNVQPRLRLRRVFYTTFFGDAVSGAALEADVGLDGMASVEASVRDSRFGSTLVLRSDVRTDLGSGLEPPERTLEWSKHLIMPGLLDSATRLTLRSSLDLRTGKPSAEVKLGLRRKQASRGLRLVHRLGLPQLEGVAGRCSLDVGGTLTLPDSLVLSTEAGGGPRQLLDAARVQADFDTFDLLVDL